jgi:hypothetical protein
MCENQLANAQKITEKDTKANDGARNSRNRYEKQLKWIQIVTVEDTKNK